ncbi:MAG: hypothetical protein M3015_11385 [Bacteroidota bacterium]|nr:hypothetical protein [Bacteroidota bacterium]
MSGLNYIRTKEHFDWLDKCLKCWRTCEDFIAHSIENGRYVNTINICRDVAEMCSQCIKFEAQRSPFFEQLCEVCADICISCVKALNEYKNDDVMCKKTAEACNDLVAAGMQISQKRKEHSTQ